MTTPASVYQKNTDYRYSNLKLTGHNKLTGKTIERYKGHSAREFRLIAGHVDSASQQEEIGKLLKELMSDAKIDSLSIVNLDNANMQLKLEYNVGFSDIEQLMNSRLLIKPFQYMSKTENPFHTDERKFSIVFDYPYRLNEVINIELEDEWEIEALPENVLFRNKVGICQAQFINMGTRLSVQRMFQIDKAMWKKSLYPQTKALFEKRELLNDFTIVLKKKESDGE